MTVEAYCGTATRAVQSFLFALEGRYRHSPVTFALEAGPDNWERRVVRLQADRKNVKVTVG